jgi:hypothetical protein
VVPQLVMKSSKEPLTWTDSFLINDPSEKDGHEIGNVQHKEFVQGRRHNGSFERTIQILS